MVYVLKNKTRDNEHDREQNGEIIKDVGCGREQEEKGNKHHFYLLTLLYPFYYVESLIHHTHAQS